MKEILEAIRHKDLVVDGDSLTDYMRRRQRTLERNYGGAV